MYGQQKLPYAMGVYGLATTCAGAVAPTATGYLIASAGWRWAVWEFAIICGVSLILLAFTMPEVRVAPSYYRSLRLIPIRHPPLSSYIDEQLA
jgi:MFS family permease